MVDLDQTIIHAAVDPTIAEWQKDKDNPNHDAVKDVCAFQLIDDGPGMRGCWYYIKLRPGLKDFLEKVSHIYEMHIYTMGTRQYAEKIADIVDPGRHYFADRILSRDESGSMTNKNLERLFPIDTKMVVIIDDRGDVWKWNANLVRVVPFDFFVGIGDINSSFLPKQQEIKAASSSDKPEDVKLGDASTNGQHKSKLDESAQVSAEGTNSTATNGSDTSALEQLVAMGGGDDPVVREIQSKGQEETIAAQLEEKPLLKMQKLLDAKDEEEAAAATAVDQRAEDIKSSHVEGNGDTQDPQLESSPSSSTSSEANEPSATTPPKPVPTRHSLLRDDDRELISLSTRLRAVHTAFYNEYDRQRLGQKGGRVAALSGKGRKMQLQNDMSASSLSQEDVSDLLLVPDIKTVMPGMKNRVLSGVVIVFSGVLPLGTDVQSADISLWAKTFGAIIEAKVGRKVTHVVAARYGTSKVKQGLKRGLWIVGTQWLIDSMTGWNRVKEESYVLPDLKGERKVEMHGDGNGEEKSEEKGDERKELLESNRGSFLLSSDEGEGETTGLDTEAETEDNRPTTKGTGTDKDGAIVTSGLQPAKKRLKLDTNLVSNAAEEDTATTNDDTINGFIEDASPLSINQDEWADMDKELREFIGSDLDTDSETDSIISKPSPSRNANKKKRKREVDGDEEAEEGRELESDESGRHGGGLEDFKDDNEARPSSSIPPPANPSSPSITITNPTPNQSSNSTLSTTLATEDGDGDADEDENAVRNGVGDEVEFRHQRQNVVESARAREDADAADLSSDDELARELEREFDDSSDDDDDGGGNGAVG